MRYRKNGPLVKKKSELYDIKRNKRIKKQRDNNIFKVLVVLILEPKQMTR